MANTYDSYKDSGIAWIGDIPSGWEIKRLGNFYNPRNEKVSDKDFPPLSVTMKGIVPQLETAAKTDDGDNRKLVKKGDFAINSRSDRRGSCGISDYDGSVSLINTVLCPKGQMNAGFYNWLFHTSMFADEYYKWGHGIVDDLWTTKWSDMKNICVVVPSLEEQSSIATFLDQKCAEIDSLISLQEEMISELQAYKQSIITEAVTKGLDKDVKMKDSGVEWIGEIPENWEVFKIKQILRNKSIKNFPNEMVLSLYRDLGIVPKDSRDDNHNVTSEDTASYKLVEKGDFVLNKMKAWQGSMAVSDYRGIISPAYYICEFKRQDLDRKYIHYLLRNESYKPEYLRLSTGLRVGQWDLNIDTFLNIPMIFPSLQEQFRIATYLDTKTAEIDSLIALKQQKITELKDYKKSIIYEYVTGKKEVV